MQGSLRQADTVTFVLTMHTRSLVRLQGTCTTRYLNSLCIKCN